MMERLTIDEIIEHCKRKTEKYEYLNGANKLENSDISFSFIKEYWEHRQVKEYLEELKIYRNLKEQDLLLQLPCKVGDTVFDNDFGRTVGYEVTGFSFGDMNEDDCDDKVKVFNQIIVYYKNSKGSITGSFAVSELGKTVFLTQAETEQKLKEMESE